MLDRWNYAWNKFNNVLMDDFAADKIDEEEMERRLDAVESTSSVESLIKTAKSFGYEIKMPKSA